MASIEHADLSDDIGILDDGPKLSRGAPRRSKLEPNEREISAFWRAVCTKCFTETVMAAALCSIACWVGLFASKWFSAAMILSGETMVPQRRRVTVVLTSTDT